MLRNVAARQRLKGLERRPGDQGQQGSRAVAGAPCEAVLGLSQP